jgi:hypothetical protein
MKVSIYSSRNYVGLALCGEFMGALPFLIQTGRLIYVSREQATVAESPEPLKNSPYFGFTGKYFNHFNNQQFYTNSLGFCSVSLFK